MKFCLFKRVFGVSWTVETHSNAFLRLSVPYNSQRYESYERCGRPLSPAGGGSRGWNGISKNPGRFITPAGQVLQTEPDVRCNGTQSVMVLHSHAGAWERVDGLVLHKHVRVCTGKGGETQPLRRYTGLHPITRSKGKAKASPYILLPAMSGADALTTRVNCC